MFCFSDADSWTAAASQDSKAQRAVNGKIKTEMENEEEGLGINEIDGTYERGKGTCWWWWERKNKGTWKIKNSFHSSFNSLSAELRKKSKKSVKVMNKATARIREKQKLCENAVLQWKGSTDEQRTLRNLQEHKYERGEKKIKTKTVVKQNTN